MYEDSLDPSVERDSSTREGQSATGKRGPPDQAKKAERAKRVRVSRACDQCRAGREKCDGAQPICQTCQVQERSCTYNEPAKKRGIQPNYIRTLELTLAWLLQTYPGCEARLSRRLPNADDEVHKLIAFKDANTSEGLHAVWRNGIISRQIDQLLSGSTIELPRSSNSHEDVDHEPVGPYNSPPQSAPSDTSLLPQDQRNASGEALSPVIDLMNRSQTHVETLQLPQKAWAMLEDYFAFTQTWLPITEKSDILRLMYTYPAAGLPRSEAASSEHAELWSIMAWSAARRGSNKTGIDFAVCRDIARSLIPREAAFNTGHVKALLILGLIDLAQGFLVPAWLSIGSAIRLLTILTSGGNTETTLSGDRVRHTYLAAFVLENTVASRTGAVVHLKPDDVKSFGLLVEDGLEEWSPWHDPADGTTLAAAKAPARSISTFNELVRMALRRHLESMTSPGSLAGHSELDVVYELLRNACVNNSRAHPSSLLARYRSETGGKGDGRRDDLHFTSTPALSHARAGSSQIDLWNTQLEPQGNFMDQQYPFMSIPNETDSLTGSTPAQATATGATPSLWQGENAQPGIAEASGSSTGGPANAGGSRGDIFEELAMLERTDSTQNPNFMENLGFGPDLDLAEFFGADYQPSDPLLAYMQPDAFGDLSQAFDPSGKEVG